MSSLPRAFFLAIAQLGDRAILRVLAKSAAITVVIFVALGWGASFGFDALLARFGLYGPPGIIFFDRGGREISGLRVVGFQEAPVFVRQLERAAERS